MKIAGALMQRAFGQRGAVALEAAAAAARKARGAPGAGRSQVPVGTVSVRTGPTPDVMIGKPVSILGSLHPPAMERNH